MSSITAAITSVNAQRVLLVLLAISAFAAFFGPQKWETDQVQQWSVEGISQQPTQIHISWEERDDCMVVTWATSQDTNMSQARFRLANTNTVFRIQEGKSWSFVDQHAAKREQFFHRAAMCELQSSRKYEYFVGDPLSGWSSVFRFTSKPHGSDWGRPTVFGVYGDLGDANSRSLSHIQESVERGDDMDAILHVGDFAYDMNEENGRRGDSFMNDIQSVATILPYQTCPGNHEIPQNFNHYKNRFGTGFNHEGHQQVYYSFNAGLAHVISFSSELYFADQAAVPDAFHWLVKDLAEANKNRDKRPWIIFFMHRPLYCSNVYVDCFHIDWAPRRGLKQPDGSFLYGLEDVLFTHGVDIALFGHLHSYERLFPLYDWNVAGGEHSSYVNPKATTHIIAGSGGCREKLQSFEQDPKEWSAKRVKKYGWAKLRVINSTDVHWQWFSIGDDINDPTEQTLEDEIWLHQERHSPFPDVVINAPQNAMVD